MQVLTRPPETHQQHPMQQRQRRTGRHLNAAHDHRADPTHHHPESKTTHPTIIATPSTSHALQRSPGWLNVLLPLKACVDHRVDLHNHDPAPSWDQGYVDH